MIQLINLFDFVHQAHTSSSNRNSCRLVFSTKIEHVFCKQQLNCDVCPYFRNNVQVIADTLEKVIANHDK